jgi:hypothetical protein
VGVVVVLVPIMKTHARYSCTREGARFAREEALSVDKVGKLVDIFFWDNGLDRGIRRGRTKSNSKFAPKEHPKSFQDERSGGCGTRITLVGQVSEAYGTVPQRPAAGVRLV